MKSIMACEKVWFHNFCHDNSSRLIFHALVAAEHAPLLDCGTQTIHIRVVDACGEREVSL